MDPGVSQAWDNTVAEYLPPWHSWRRGGADSSQHYSKRSTNIGARGMGAVEIIRHAYHSYLLREGVAARDFTNDELDAEYNQNASEASREWLTDSMVQSLEWTLFDLHKIIKQEVARQEQAVQHSTEEDDAAHDMSNLQIFQDIKVELEHNTTST
ncbi:hypothetical protein VCV18_005227 [Metarhizium anisopliae]